MPTKRVHKQTQEKQREPVRIEDCKGGHSSRQLNCANVFPQIELSTPQAEAFQTNFPSRTQFSFSSGKMGDPTDGKTGVE